MKSSDIWKFTDNITAYVNFLKGVIIFESFLVVLLVLVLSNVSRKKQEIIVVPGAQEEMVFKPGKLNDVIVKDLALHIVSLYSTFTPATFKSNVERLLKYFSPLKYSELKVKLLSRNEEIQRSTYSQVFIPEHVDIIKKGGGDVSVRVTGVLNIMIADKPVERKRAIYSMVFVRVEPTKENPYGLQLKEIKIEGEGYEK